MRNEGQEAREGKRKGNKWTRRGRRGRVRGGEGRGEWGPDGMVGKVNEGQR